MAKGSENGQNPSVNWFFNDWHGGTMTFSRHLKGCYMDLMTAQFNTGHLSLEEVKTVLASDFGTAWPTLQKKFKVDSNGLYYQDRLESEIKKKRDYSKGRKTNLKGDKKHSPHMGSGSGLGNGKEDLKGGMGENFSENIISQNCQELLSNQLFHEQSCISLSSLKIDLNLIKFKDWVQKFIDEKRATGELNVQFKDARRHCFNWIKSELKKINGFNLKPTKSDEQLDAIGKFVTGRD